MPLAVFHCDASPAIGGGHVARCRALAATMGQLGWRHALTGAAGAGAIPDDYIRLLATPWRTAHETEAARRRANRFAGWYF